MDIDLRLPSGDQCKDDNEAKIIDNALESVHNFHNEDMEIGKIEDVAVELNADSDAVMNIPTAELVDFRGEMHLEPFSGMEFESHGEAYSFYQEYARAMGFNTAIQNSRRSKTSREFIDAKFACSRYGTKREYDKPSNRPRARQIKRDPENTAGRRACTKTDCKASMHVKRRSDGKWIVHGFVKEHNHELLPAQAVGEQTRKMYAAMARQFAEYKNVISLKSEPKHPSGKLQNLTLEAGDAKILLDFFVRMQNTNSNFFYAVDIGEDNSLKTLLWVDAKSRRAYGSFSDVVSFDTTYIINKYKMPLALFVGVNQHYQFMLLGCALLSDESAATYSWVMETWLKAMGGRTPKVMVTNHEKVMNSVISEVFPDSRHCFFLWHVLAKVSENLGQTIKQHGNFTAKFEKCIYKSWKDQDFAIRWGKMLERFGLREDSWMHSLYEDRRKWVPAYMTDVLLAGMSTSQRSESVNSFFDKYVHKKTNMKEFVKLYDVILQDRYEEEAKADMDSWNKQPAMKSPSPFEKSVSGVYTPAVFRKFQAEVLGAIACSPKEENRDEACFTFRVRDFEKNQDFVVTWNQMKAEVSCICRLFEFKGYLCRHALNVLQCCHLSAVPSQYILKRWTKDAKTRRVSGVEPDQLQSRLQRYNDLCQRALELSEEASFSQESYGIAFRAVEEALENCASVINTVGKSPQEVVTSPTQGLISIEEDNSQTRSTSKTSKKKTPAKKRKVNLDQDVNTVGAPESSLQQMDKLSPRTATLEGYYGTHQGVPGMVQLNLMAPTRDNFYGNQQTIQGLGQLNSIAASHDGYYNTQQGIHSLSQMDFFRSPGFTYDIREDPGVRPGQLHEDASRHT